MATMNKPAYAAIQTYAPTKPSLVFVSSRRQTRLTALDLIGFAAADERPQQFVHMPDEEIEAITATLKAGRQPFHPFASMKKEFLHLAHSRWLHVYLNA